MRWALFAFVFISSFHLFLCRSAPTSQCFLTGIIPPLQWCPPEHELVTDVDIGAIEREWARALEQMRIHLCLMHMNWIR